MTASMRQLLQHTSGLPDHWDSAPFLKVFDADDRRNWTTWQLLGFPAAVPAMCKVRRTADAFAAGRAVSTAGDLARFLAALSQGTLFRNTSTSLAVMQSWLPADASGAYFYGLGLMRIDCSLTLGGAGARAQRGSLWGHEGYGGAFAYVWVPAASGGEQLAFTGAAGNAEHEMLYDLI